MEFYLFGFSRSVLPVRFSRSVHIPIRRTHLSFLEYPLNALYYNEAADLRGPISHTLSTLHTRSGHWYSQRPVNEKMSIQWHESIRHLIYRATPYVGIAEQAKLLLSSIYNNGHGTHTFSNDQTHFRAPPCAN